MTQPAATPRMSPDAFLAWEREQREPHIYFHGEIFALSGGSPRHSRLSSRVIARLDTALSGKPCDVHTADLRLATDDEHVVYADAVVVCRPLAFRAGTTDTVTNPVVVVEVLAKSTESYDRGDKQAAYLALPSLRHLVLISQRAARVEVYTRESDGAFHFDVLGAGDVLRLEKIGAEIAVDDLHAGVFELPGEDRGRPYEDKPVAHA